MMTPMNRSARAIQTLAKADPEFTEFVQKLYGPGVDPQVIWDDVYGVNKLAPDPSDLNQPGQPGDGKSKLKTNLALAGVGAGALLGAGELVREVPKLGGKVGAAGQKVADTGTKATKLIPTGARRALSSPKGKVGVAATALAADALAGDEISSHKQPAPPPPPPWDRTAKRAPHIKELADGRRKINRALIPTDHPALKGVLPKEKAAPAKAAPKSQKPQKAKEKVKKLNMRPPGTGKHRPGVAPAPAPVTPPAQPAAPKLAPTGKHRPGSAAPLPMSDGAKAKAGKQFAQGAKAADDFKTFAGTTPGKAVLGGAAVYGGLKAYRHHQNNQMGGYDPYSYYGKRDEAPEVEWEGNFAKFDEDKRLAFGYASVVSIGGQPVIDRQGDLIEMEDIEKAAYDYVQRSRKGGGMHVRDNDDQAVHISDLVESFVITDEKVEKMGLPAETPRGWWVGFKVNDDDAWTKVRKGEWTGFSIHGKGKRIEKSLDEAMGY
jgi:hypothetical protein